MSETPDNQGEISEARQRSLDNLKPHQFKPGQSGNLKGRTPGKTLKEYTREMLAKMTDAERDDFLKGLDKKDIWQMSEGKPDTKTAFEGNVNIIGNVIQFADGKSKTNS